MRFALCVYKHFPYSGLSRDMLRIIDECNRRGHAVAVFCREWQGPIPDDVAVEIIPTAGLTNHARAASYHRRLHNRLAADSYDAVVGFNKMPGLDIYYAADFCYAGRARIRHGSAYRLTPRYLHYQKFERSVFGPDSATKILCLSDRERTVYQQLYATADNRFAQLPPALDRRRLRDCSSQTVDRVRRELGIGGHTFLILFVGSGFKTKGLDRAIEALAGLPADQLKRSRLLVVGQDNAKPFRRLARSLSVLENVRFLGGRSDVPELLCAGDLLIHPAYWENTGLILLEAITAGLPVLTTDVCGYAPHVTAAQAGRVLASPFSQQDLNQALAEMLISDQRAAWKNNGLAYRNNAELYTMPDRAVDMMERWTRDRAAETAASEGRRGKPAMLWLHDDFRKALDGADDFEDVMGISGEVYRRAPGRQTLRFTRRGKAYFLKAHSGVGWREIARNLLCFRMPVTGADNEWLGVHLLQRLDIDTMHVVAYGNSGGNPARRRSFIVTEEVPATVSLEEYCSQWQENPPQTPAQQRFKRWLIRETARIARAMHGSGANHRDLYLCHLLLEIGADSQGPAPDRSKVYVIDLHRMQLRRRTPKRWLIKDIAGLYYSSMDIGLTRRDLFRFITAYDGKPLRDALSDNQQFWHRVERRALNLYEQERHKTHIAVSSAKRQAAVSTTAPH